MEFRFNVTGADRKAIVKAMGDILQVKPKYLGMPTAAYEVDYFTVDKNGTVSFDDRADSEDALSAYGRKRCENLIEKLDSLGFHAADAEVSEEEETALTVEMPLDKVKVGNLTALLEAKGKLIKKAFGIEDTAIEVTNETVKFPWFSELPDPDTVKAYTHFISALCEMTRNAKRVTATEKAVENEKYAFRCFLLRLGFIGAEYKAERKILLKNLTGSSAFKDGGKNDEVSE